MKYISDIQLLYKEGDAENFQIPMRNCQLIFQIPISLSKERFPYQVLPIFKLHNVKLPLLS